MADNNATDTTKDGQKQVHSENGIRSPSPWGPTKTKGKLAQGTCLKESLKNGREGEVLPSTKKPKNHTKTSTKRVSVVIEVLLHPRRQKNFLHLLRGINFEERSRIIARVHLLHLIHRRYILSWSLQRQEV